jgi:hypothetical protein
VHTSSDTAHPHVLAVPVRKVVHAYKQPAIAKSWRTGLKVTHQVIAAVVSAASSPCKGALHSVQVLRVHCLSEQVRIEVDWLACSVCCVWLLQPVHAVQVRIPSDGACAEVEVICAGQTQQSGRGSMSGRSVTLPGRAAFARRLGDSKTHT